MKEIELNNCPHCGGKVQWCICGHCARIECKACQILTEFIGETSDDDTLEEDRARIAVLWNRHVSDN